MYPDYRHIVIGFIIVYTCLGIAYAEIAYRDTSKGKDTSAVRQRTSITVINRVYLLRVVLNAGKKPRFQMANVHGADIGFQIITMTI